MTTAPTPGQRRPDPRRPDLRHPDPGRRGREQATCPTCAQRQTELGITRDPSRRRFLKHLAFGGASLAVGGGLLGGLSSVGAIPVGRPTLGRAVPPPSTGTRRLVVIELPGGNDGLSTLVPHGIGRYHDLRPRTAIASADVIDIDGTVGLHPNLSRVAGRGVAVLQGVGQTVPDLSHFTSFDRMWRGDVDGTSDLRTGFLGRVCDQLAADELATGVSLGWGPTPALLADQATTLAMPEPDAAEVFTGRDEFQRTVQQGLRTMAAATPGQPGDHEWLPMARRGLGTAIEFAGLLDQLADAPVDYDEDVDDLLVSQLALAGRLLATPGGPRVIHVPMDADFDTHEGHADSHPGFMERLDVAVDTFMTDLERRGLLQDTLIVTTSEFGRRPDENGSAGVDHGTASVALLLGPVAAGLHGEHPSLTHLDEEDNLIATVGLDRYYASIAEDWLGIPSSAVLDGQPAPVEGMIIA